MVDIALKPVAVRAVPDAGAWSRLKVNRNWLGLWFMLPTAAFLLLFLAYPLGLGVWLSFTDARIGRLGEFVGTENYEWLSDDATFWLSVFNTVLYTCVASVFKFAIGLYLAILLNENLPFKALIRALILIPFIVPTVLSAIAFWWIYDAQFSIVSWSLRHLGLIDHNINFLGDVWNARWSVIFANVWRGVPFVAITLLAGLQTVPPSLYEAATIDGATPWQMFRYITLPLILPFIFIAAMIRTIDAVKSFDVIFAITQGGPGSASETINLYLYSVAFVYYDLGYGSAIAVIFFILIVMLAAVLLYLRQRTQWTEIGPGA